MPGEVFVHRNVAYVVMQTDLNCMSVVDFAIHKLKVKHVIVCGHYGCAGVHASMDDKTVGAVDHWLSGIRELWELHNLISLNLSFPVSFLVVLAEPQQQLPQKVAKKIKSESSF